PLPARTHSGLPPSGNYCVSLDIIHNSIIRKKYLARVSRKRNTPRGPWRRSVAKQELQGRMAGSKSTRAGRASARTLFLSDVHLGFRHARVRERSEERRVGKEWRLGGGAVR